VRWDSSVSAVTRLGVEGRGNGSRF